MLMIGVIGCGTIGGEICRAIDRGIVRAELAGICDIDLAKANDLARSLEKGAHVMDQRDLIKASELVVEAVSKAAAPSIIREVLGCSKDVLVMSVGGLLECSDELIELAKTKERRIYVPSGAIAGLDAVKGAIVGSVSKVTLTTRKPPRGLKGAPYIVENKIDLENLKEPTLIFSGPARKAVSGFPANINVGAALSLAGIGSDKTMIRIIADPRAALSAIGLLQRITSSLVVGT